MVKQSDTSKLLFGDRLAPITEAMGFIEADQATVERHFVAWHKELIGQSKNHVSVSTRHPSGSLEHILLSLLPLSRRGARRYLLIPTRSRWTAFLDNGWRGTDAAAVSYLPILIGCRSVYMVATPHTLKHTGIPRHGRQGAAIFSLYGSHDFGVWLNLIREVRLVNDAGHWEFETSGPPLPFEDTMAYQALFRSNRFNLSLLRDYLLALDIAAFDETFYLPPDNPEATLVELRGGYIRKLEDVSLDEARYWEHESK